MGLYLQISIVFLLCLTLVSILYLIIKSNIKEIIHDKIVQFIEKKRFIVISKGISKVKVGRKKQKTSSSHHRMVVTPHRNMDPCYFIISHRRIRILQSNTISPVCRNIRPQRRYANNYLSGWNQNYTECRLPVKIYSRFQII